MDNLRKKIESVQQQEELIKKETIEIPKEDFELIETIAKRVGGDFGMTVKLGEPGEGSFFDPENCSITFDPLHIKENLDQAKFIAGHEGAHRAITLNPIKFGLTEEQIKELYSQIGFGYIQNVIEDPAVNDWMREKFPGLDEYVKKFYNEQLKEENVALTTPEIERIVTKIGYWPKFVQYGSEIIRYWHQKRFSKKLDPAVDKALKRTIKYVSESIKTIPDSKKVYLDKKEIIEKAKKRFEINTNNVWLEVKKLIDLDLDTEKQRQMMQDFRKKEKELEERRKELEKVKSRGGKEKEEELEREIKKLEKELEPFNSLQEDVKKELKEKIGEAIKEMVERIKKENEEKKKQIETIKQEKEKLEKEIKDLEEKLKKTEGEKEKKELEKQLKEKKEEELIKERKQEDLKEGLKDFPIILLEADFPITPEGNLLIPFPEDKLSEKTKNELKKLFKKLPKEKQKELEKHAERQLEDLEDVINKEITGKLNKDKPESHKEIREKEEREKELEEERKKSEEEKKELEKKLEEMRREKMTEYDKAYEDVSGVINSLYIRLKNFFIPERHPKWKKDYPTGSRINLEKTMQSEADPRYLDKIWERKTIPQKFDYRFSILVDLSGSMRGEKIEETFKGLVILAEVLEKLKIRYEINGFQDTLIHYKSFKERLNDEKRNKIATAKKEPFDNGLNNKSQWNSDGYCLEQAYKRLIEDLGKDNFLIVLSDGMPVPDPIHKSWDLNDVIAKIIKERKVKLIGIGLGPDTEHVEEYYPYGFANMTVRVSEEEKRNGKKDFAEALADILEDMIRHPGKYEV